MSFYSSRARTLVALSDRIRDFTWFYSHIVFLHDWKEGFKLSCGQVGQIFNVRGLDCTRGYFESAPICFLSQADYGQC